MRALTFFQFIRNHGRILLILVGLFTLVCGFGAGKISVDNSLPVWQSSNDPNWVRYQEFIQAHQITDPLLIYLPESNYEITLPLSDTLATLEQVDHINTLTVQPASGEKSTLISLFPLYGTGPKDLSQLLGSTEKTLQQQSVKRYHLGGVWLLTDKLDKLSSRATQTMFPLVIALLTGILFLLFRNSKDVVLIMACGLLPGLQLTGLMGLAGIKMNMVLLALPPLTLILGISHGIHLLSKQTTGLNEPLERVAQVAPPCLLSGITTALGFLSLLFSQYHPVQELGAWGATGALLSLLNSLILLPVFFKKARKNISFQFLEPLAQTIFRRKNYILPGVMVAIILSLLGTRQLQRGSFILDFFSEDSAVTRDYQVIEQVGIGLTPLEIDLEKTDLTNQQIAEIIQELNAEEPAITHDLYAFNSGIVVPRSTPHGAQFLTFSGLNFMLEDISRITLLTKTMASEKTLAMVDEIENFCQNHFGKRDLPYVTGSIPLYTRGQKTLFSSLMISFSIAFISISLIMGLVLRSFRLGLLAILPNLLPVLLVLGFMGIAGIPLSVATVTVASIVFGIVVDDTIHFLHNWKQSQSTTNSLEKLGHVFATTGPAMIMTTCIAGIGFLGFAASPFMPLRNFGLLISLAMWLALFCDLVLLPALLLSGTTRE